MEQKLKELEDKIEKLSERCSDCNTVICSPLGVYNRMCCYNCEKMFCPQCYTPHEKEKELRKFSKYFKESLQKFSITVPDLVSGMYDKIGCERIEKIEEKEEEEKKESDYEDLVKRIEDLEERLDSV